MGGLNRLLLLILELNIGLIVHKEYIAIHPGGQEAVEYWGVGGVPSFWSIRTLAGDGNSCDCALTSDTLAMALLTGSVFTVKSLLMATKVSVSSL